MDEIFEITSEDLTAHVMFEPQEMESKYFPSVGGIVEIVSAGFVGVNRTVWYKADALLSFADALQSVLNHQQGVATLVPMTPDDLRVVVQPHGKRGQLRVDATMRKYGAAYEGFEHSMSTGFLADRDSAQASVYFLKRLARSLETR